jgi:hypothetical protein
MDVTASGGMYYINDESKPIIYLARGHTYLFSMTSATYTTHPFTFRQGSVGAYSAYTGGVEVLAESNGIRQVKIRVRFDTPNQIEYYCTAHDDMGNTIAIIPQI